MKATQFCVHCDKHSQVFNGHFHKGGQIIVAGYCMEHSGGELKEIYRHLNGKKDCSGCLGEYDEKNGVRDLPKVKNPLA